MPAPTDAWDYLCVISDLHIEVNPNLFGPVQAQRLAELLDTLSEKAADRSVCLIVNGDFIDFLALYPKDAPRYFHPSAVEDMIDRVRDRWPDVFVAFGKLATKATVIVTIGNHDLELAKPGVLDRLIPGARLGGGSGLELTRYRCSVGGVWIKCVHGNSADAWNVVDYELLEQRCLDGRDDGKRWANAGTCLVVDAMNIAKEREPFVDLLKPEGLRIVPILLRRQPDLASRIRQLLRVPYRHQKGKKNRRILGSSGMALPAPPLSQLLEEAAGWRALDLDPLSLVESNEENLGLFDSFGYLLFGSETSLYDEFKDWFGGHEGTRATFSLDGPDVVADYYSTQPHEEDILVAGHTHLARFLQVYGKTYYYNTGTWATMMRLEDRYLDSPESFLDFSNALDLSRAAKNDEKLLPLEPFMIRPCNHLIIEKLPGGGAQSTLYGWLPDGSRSELHQRQFTARKA